MRDYGTIYAGFWANESLRAAGDDARMLAAYLLTSPHTNASGVFRLPDAYACEDLDWNQERLRNGFQTLSAVGFIRHDPETKWVWIVKFLTFNRPANPNIWKAIHKAVFGIPEKVSFRSEVISMIGVSETVSKPLGNTPSPSPSPSPVLEGGAGETIGIPLDDGTEHPVTPADLAEYRVAYPAIDPAAEARKARAWSLSNPANRKTRRGVGKFLNGWMARAQRDAESKPKPPAPKARRQL